MTDTDARTPPTTQTPFVSGSDYPPIRLAVLEGKPSDGAIEIKPMMVGEHIVLIELAQKAGATVEAHSHHDHESILYLIRGRMELTIGEERFVAKAGDVWRHPADVSHSSVALEDSLVIETKSPPRKTWGSEPR